MSKHFRKDVWQEVQRKQRENDGTRRWQSEVRRFGETVVPLIPEGLKARVLGTPVEVVLPDVQVVLDKLMATRQEAVEIDPYLVLRKRLGK